MQCTQFLVNTMHRSHPSHSITGCPPGARPNMSPTLQQCFGREATKYATDGVVSEISYKKAVKSIHTDAVTTYLENQAPETRNPP